MVAGRSSITRSTPYYILRTKENVPSKTTIKLKTMEEKKRYSDEELEEFRAIINQKIRDCKV